MTKKKPVPLPHNADNIGTRIKQRRLALGLTMTALAEKSKVSIPTISVLEAGKHKSTTTIHLRLLAQALGVTCDELVIGPVRSAL